MVLAGIDLVPLTVILLAAALSGIIAARVRQPLLVGYILAGLILGPTVLGLSPSTTLTSTLGDLGLAFLLFLIGLEMDIRSIKPLLNNIVGISVPLMGILASTGAIIGLLFGFTLSASIIVGIAVMYGSTAVVVKMLTDQHKDTTTAGRLDMGVLLFEDIVVILIMAVLTTGAVGLTSFIYESIIVLTSLGVITVCAILIGRKIGPLLLRPMARRSEALLITGISWCFAGMWLAETAGLSVEIGAFIAGVSLAQIPFTTELREDIRPLSTLFMALFFINFGLELSPSDLTGLLPQAVIAAAVLMVVKFVSIYLLIRHQSFDTKTSFTGAILMTQTSEFALILGSVAVSNGYIDTEIVGFLSIVTMLTMTVSSYLIMYHESIYKLLNDRLGSSNNENDRSTSYSSHSVVIGLTPSAKQVAERLSERGEDVVIVDTDPDVIEQLQDTELEAVFGNIRHKEIREEIEMASADMVFSTIEDFDLSETLVRELPGTVTTILTAQTERERDRLYADGADLVILDHEIAGYALSVDIRELLEKGDTDE